MGAQRYENCSNCRTMVCANCYDEATQRCIKCDRAQGVGSQSGTSASASSTVCPNCQTPSQGGRFCHECGFDMASTHKSCPSCGATDASPGALLHRLRTRLLALAPRLGPSAHFQRRATPPCPIPEPTPKPPLRAGDPARALQASDRGGARPSPPDAKLRIFLAQLLCVLGPVGTCAHPAQRRRRHGRRDGRDARDGRPRDPLRADARQGVRRPAHADGVRPARRVAGAADRVAAAAGAGRRGAGRRLWRRAPSTRRPSVSGKLDGQAFEWIADADSRLGPVLEACVNGRYYWVPLPRLSRVDVRSAGRPARLRLDAGAADVLQRRRDGRAGSDALSGLGGERATARSCWRARPSGATPATTAGSASASACSPPTPASTTSWPCAASSSTTCPDSPARGRHEWPD